MDPIQEQTMRCIMAISRSDSPEEDPEFELRKLEALVTETASDGGEDG
jgi:hypothetical protein